MPTTPSCRTPLRRKRCSGRCQIEYNALPQFALSDALVDLKEFGADDLKDNYTQSTWGGP